MELGKLREGLPSVEPVIGELKCKLNEGVRVQRLLLGELFAKRCESVPCDLQIRRLAKGNRRSEKSPGGRVQSLITRHKELKVLRL